MPATIPSDLDKALEAALPSGKRSPQNMPLPPPVRSVPSEPSVKKIAIPTSICHGIVKEEDFEKMIPAQWWKTVFADDLYLKTDGDVVEDPEITREEIKYYILIYCHLMCSYFLTLFLSV